MSHNIKLPQLLVASPLVDDPEFAKTVILVTNHDRDKGSIAFVLTREMAIMPNYSEVILSGGPVSFGDYYTTIHSCEWKTVGSIDVGGVVCVSSMADVLEAVSSGSGPVKRAHFTGYAGFAPNEIEETVAEGIWLPIDFHEKYVFDIPPHLRWQIGMMDTEIKPSNVVYARFGPGKVGLN